MNSKKSLCAVLAVIELVCVSGCSLKTAGRGTLASVAETAGAAGAETTSQVEVPSAPTDADVFENAFSDAKDETSAASSPAPVGISDYVSVDLDLTNFESTMLYSQLYHMNAEPDDYIGKTVKLKGYFDVYQDVPSNKLYYLCTVMDATACCSQGLEFVLSGEPSYPEGYPEKYEYITVAGVFETYTENGYVYCTLKNAVLF